MTTSLRILVIEDTPDIGLMLKMMLEYKGFSVKKVQNADNLLELIRAENIQLIIMDMLLSGKNGIEICSALKFNPATAAIPIIMMSAHPDAKEKCLAGGADEFVFKPFEISEMIEKINLLESGVRNLTRAD